MFRQKNMGKKDDLIIGCDLFLDLRLYHLPNSFLQTFKEKYPHVKLIEFNTPRLGVKDPEKIDIYWGNRINKTIIDKCTLLKWIHFGSVGVNAAMTSEVVERKIRVSNSSGIMTDAVVATGLAFLFSLARGFHRTWHLQQNELFNRKSFDKYFDQAQDVFGQTVLIAGFGEIGEKLAQACHAIGLKIMIIRKNPEKIPKWVEKTFSINELKKAVQDSDYIINLLPLTNQTRAVFSRDVFRKMKQSSFFINIGRGDTVVEDDLINALLNNVIAGAGIDVFNSSSYVDPSTPLRLDSPLLSLDNVILTPHIAGLTNKYWEKECTLFLDNLERFDNGKNLINEVSIEEFLPN